MLYGLENSFNWGWDWFESRESALEAKRNRPRLYAHNGEPLKMTKEQIRKENL